MFNWEAISSGSYSGCGRCVGSRGLSVATDGAGSRSLRIVECTARTSPAMLLGAAQAQNLIKVGFLPRRFADGTARRGTSV